MWSVAIGVLLGFGITLTSKFSFCLEDINLDKCKDNNGINRISTKLSIISKDKIYYKCNNGASFMEEIEDLKVR